MSAAEALPSTPLGCVVRDGVAADAPLIFNAWSRGAREAPPANLTPSGRWSAHQTAHVERCVARSRVLVAAHADDANAVLGFIAFEHRAGLCVVHWAYTKRLFRRMGVGSHLLERALEGAASSPVVFTQPGRDLPWLSRRLTLAYDPWIVGEP